MSVRTANLPVAFVEDQAHRHAGHRRAQRHAGVHHRHRAAAHAGHRRGAVALEDVRDDADGVGELLLGRHHRHQRPFGQRTVADLTSARAAHEAGLADRERREVVVQHEPLVRLAVHGLDLLLIVGGAERRGDERLRLATREDDRPVDAGQHLTSVQIGRISSNWRPSRRCPRSRISLRSTFSFRPLKTFLASTRRSISVSGNDATSSASTWSTRP